MHQISHENSNKQMIAATTLASIICFLVYVRALSCGFVLLDDPDYVVQNQFIRNFNWDFISWAFTSSHASFWMPLTWVSLSLDYQLWHLNPLGYHLTNVILHSLNTSLVLLIADHLYTKTKLREKNICLPRSAYPLLPALLFTALLFGIHPLRVESVVWVTERKDVLNGFFSLGAILFYLKFVDHKQSGNQLRVTTTYYIASLVFFALSLLAKSVSVVLPAMLLVLDWFPLRRLSMQEVKRTILEKGPFIFLSIIVSAITLSVAAGNNILIDATSFPFIIRLVVAGNALFEYCRLELFPLNILPLYILAKQIPHAFVAKSVAVLLCTSIAFILRKRHPWVLSSWMLFILPVIPVSGLFQNGDQSHAARFTYLPSVLPSILISYNVLKVYGSFITRKRIVAGKALLATAILLLCCYVAITQKLIKVYDNTGTLWSRVIDYQPLGRAYMERGLYYLQQGKNKAAVDDLTNAIEIARTNSILGYNLLSHRAKAFTLLGQHQDAIQDLTEAIAIYPVPRFFYHRALNLRFLGMETEAQLDLKLAGGDMRPIEWIENSEELKPKNDSKHSSTNLR